MATSPPASPSPADDPDATERRPVEVDPDATIRALRAGEVLLGGYRLEKFLGRGGMGVVWQARDEKLGSSVALKFLPELVMADATGIEELKRETRRSRELTHPNIIRINGFCQDDRHAAIDMELVEGQNLAELRKNEAAKVFTPAQVLPWLRQLCAALDHAHEERIVHRDLKPANLMLTRAGSRLKVMDFGISATLSETVTRVSRVASGGGSPPYMSPQQMAGGRPGVADDVYSLGATLYEILTGRPPFFRGNIFQQTQNTVPPPLATRREELLAEWVDKGDVKADVVAALPPIPPEWEATIAACLAKDSEDRPKSAGEVFRRLNGEAKPVAAAKPTAAKPTSDVAPTAGRGAVRGFSAVRWIVLGVGLAALVLGAWMVMGNGNGSATSAGADKGAATSPSPASAAVMPPLPTTPGTQTATGTLPLSSSPGATKLAGDGQPYTVPPVEAVAASFVVTVEPVLPDTKLWLGPQADVAVSGGRAVLENLPPGEHELTVQAPGHQPFITQVTVKAGGGGEAKVRLVPIRGGAEFTARAGTVVTAVDAARRAQRVGVVGAGGVLTNENLLTVGTYTFRFEHDDCASVELPGELRSGRSLKLKADQVSLPGELRVFTTPPGAAVTVNGVAAGTTPATLRGQPSEAPLRIGLRLRGYRGAEQTVTLKPKEVRTLNLPPFSAEAGVVKLSVTPAEAAGSGLTVTVDGKAVVPEGGELRDLEVGKRALSVSQPDYEPWSGTAEVKDGEMTPVAVELKAKPGTLSFETTPAGAVVRVKGKEGQRAWNDVAGQEATTPFKATLPPGAYTLVFTLAGHQAAEEAVTVAANREQTVRRVLEKSRGPVAGQGWTVPELGLELVPIAAGSFRMGSENGEADEKPVTTVRLSRPYWLGKYEVTVGQWRMFAEASGYKSEAETGDGMFVWTGSAWEKRAGTSWRNPNLKQDDRHPVVGVSYNDVVKFTAWLTERERAAGRIPTGYAYTLPSEAEWEYACRAGTTGDYAGELDSMAWYSVNSGNTTKAVGTKGANAWGLYDMHGNVWEWCRDWYASSLPGGSVTDPSGAVSGASRVCRGGSWWYSAPYCRSAYRNWVTPVLRSNYLGFRVALSSSP